MARPRRQVYTMNQYLENESEGYISNNVCTQRNPKWKPIIDGLMVTILTDDYIPPIILAEEECGRKFIVDGGSRTAAFKMLCKGNYKIKSSVEDPIISYKKIEKDENGKNIWVDAEFDIRNKTFSQFPKELQKKFYEYQVETVIHECDVEQAAKYLRRYNVHTAMNANEQLFIHIPKFADEIREIIQDRFFLDCTIIKEIEKDKGVLERVVSESVMCMFHFDNWNKNGKKMAKYLNENATNKEFEMFDNNVKRLEKIITKETKELFSTKDTFVWMTFFNRFTKLGLDDSKFADFLNTFVNELRKKDVDGKCFDTVDEHGSTKDKSVISDKLHILETLMNDFLHIDNIDTTDTENNVVEESDNMEETILSFVQENANPNVTDEDINLYTDMVEDCVKIDDPVYKECGMALVALMAYVCQNDKDQDFEKWIENYRNKSEFSPSQKVNYTYMKRSFDRYVQKGATA